MKVVAIIPARYQSTRFPGKPLAKINGMSMIERVYRQVQKAACFSSIIVGTDDEKIYTEVMRFGGQVVMTKNTHRSGSERIWEIISNSVIEAVVNIQGDEPLISEILLQNICAELRKNNSSVITASFLNNEYKDFLSPHVVKVVTSSSGNAIYFSRSPIPFQDEKKFLSFFHHIGIYGYSKKNLHKFIYSEQTDLEKLEKLEQLRFLEIGIPIRVIQSAFFSYGVDVPEDIIKLEKILRK